MPLGRRVAVSRIVRSVVSRGKPWRGRIRPTSSPSAESPLAVPSIGDQGTLSSPLERSRAGDLTAVAVISQHRCLVAAVRYGRVAKADPGRPRRRRSSAPSTGSGQSVGRQRDGAAIAIARGDQQCAIAFMHSIRPASRQRSLGHVCDTRPVTRKEKLTLIATILGSTIVFLDSTVVNVALPTIQEDLDTGLAGQQWVVEAYMLSLVSLLLVGGSLGDLYGRRRLFVIGLCGFAVTSALCAIAPERRSAGGGAGASGHRRRPAGSRVAGDPRRDLRGRGARSGGRAVDGLGGDLDADRAGRGWLAGRARAWRWIFWINLPLIAVTIWLALRTIDESSDPEAVHGIDGVGIGLSALGLAGPVFALIEQPTYGFSDPIVWVPLVGGIACFGGLRLVADPRPRPAPAAGAVSLAQLRDREHGHPGRLRGARRRLLLHHPVPAAGRRLQRRSRRAPRPPR